MRNRRNTAPTPPPERRSGGRSRGSHARSQERAPARPARTGPLLTKPAGPGQPGPGQTGPGPLTGNSGIFPPGLLSGSVFPAPTGSRQRTTGARGAGPRTTGQRTPGQRATGLGSTGSAASAAARQSARWRLGPRTVRAKVVALLMVPIISLMALWGLAAVSTAQTAWSLVQLRTVNADVRQPINAEIGALQQERSTAMRLLAAPSGSPDQSGYLAMFQATDEAGGQLQTGSQDAAAALNYLGSDTQQRINALLAAVNSLGALRRQVETGAIGVSAAYSSYCAVIDDAFAVEGSLATLQDASVGSNAQSVLQLAQAGEMLARQDSVLSAAYAGGKLSQSDYQEFVGAAYTQNILQLDAMRALSPADQASYQRVVDSPLYTQLRDDQNAVAKAGPGSITATDFSRDGWSRPEAAVLTSLDAVATTAGTAAVAKLDPYSAVLSDPQGIAVLVGLFAVLLSLLVSVRIGRGLVVELVGLRDTALDLARVRLPRAIARLRAGQTVDVDVEAPPAVWVEDEIGQVSEALAAAARAAIQAAVERAEVVSAVAGVFLNLARRSQLLVHRQLALLDTMERRNDDPDELEDLFRLDHLATRMRRHAEGLIILSGAAPGRGWRKPVPLMDVLRAAVAEVEDYARVDVRRLDVVHLAGGAVADLTHLIAELVENATVFSPPHTRVQVRGEQVGSGFAIDIEDRGLGMGDLAIAEANGRIANADQTDLFDSDRLGLFVVSRLSRRHNIQVTLGRSAYGGTTAVVLLPEALLENASSGSFAEAEERGFSQTEPADAGQSRNGQPRLTGQPGRTNRAGQAGRAGGSGAEGQADGPGSEQRPGTGPILVGAPDGPADPTGSLGGPLGGQSGSGSGQGAQPPVNGFHHGTNGQVRRMPDIVADANAAPAAPSAQTNPAAPTSPSGPSAPYFEPPTAEPSVFEPHSFDAPRAAPARAENPHDTVRPDRIPPASVRPGLPAEPPAELRPDQPGGVPGQLPGQLPRRIRQANLAPQLRAEPSGNGESGHAAPQPAPLVSPERARATMTAFQDGWARGRNVYGADPGPGRPEESTAATEPGGDPAGPTHAQESS